MFGSGIIDWIYNFILMIVAYVTSWFSSSAEKNSEEEMVNVNPPMMSTMMPTLLPDLSASEETPLP